MFKRHLIFNTFKSDVVISHTYTPQLSPEPQKKLFLLPIISIFSIHPVTSQTSGGSPSPHKSNKPQRLCSEHILYSFSSQIPLLQLQTSHYPSKLSDFSAYNRVLYPSIVSTLKWFPRTHPYQCFSKLSSVSISFKKKKISWTYPITDKLKCV